MCPYEKEPGCMNCPFSNCMLRFKKSHHASGSKEKEREYNRRYKAEHREELREKDREKYRKMKAALEYCERMGIEV